VSTSDPATLAFYAAEAQTYVSVRPDEVSRFIVDFLRHLPAGASILELGCGGGADAAYMIEAGFAVEPTDGVPEMAAIAEARLGRPVRVLRFADLDAVEHYDAVIANASLLHVPREGLPDILSRIWRALKPGGWHMASYKTGADQGYDKHGRYYNQISAEQAEAVYRAAGDWQAYEVEDSWGEGYFGTPSAWLAVTAQKA
jgi:cyclopropane fatty-acyl-phospholipid synthase-like methyltransferase